MLIRQNHKIFNTDSNEMLVFRSINQAKLYNRTKLGGTTQVGVIVVKSDAAPTVTQINHVDK